HEQRRDTGANRGLGGNQQARQIERTLRRVFSLKRVARREHTAELRRAFVLHFRQHHGENGECAQHQDQRDAALGKAGATPADLGGELGHGYWVAKFSACCMGSATLLTSRIMSRLRSEDCRLPPFSTKMMRTCRGKRLNCPVAPCVLSQVSSQLPVSGSRYSR